MPPTPTATHLQTPQNDTSILEKLFEAARQILLIIRDRIPAQPTPNPSKRLIQDSFIFATLARCMRRCIILTEKLAQPPRAPRPERPERLDPQESIAPERGEQPERAPRAERLPNRPIPEIIAGIYRSLARVAARADLPPELLQSLKDLEALCLPKPAEPPRQNPPSPHLPAFVQNSPQPTPQPPPSG